MNIHETQTHTNRPRRTLIIVGALAGTLALGAGGAAIAGGPHGGFPGRAMFRLMNRLELSEQQEVKLVRIKRSMRAEAKKARGEIHGSFGSVIAELEKPAPDPAKLHALVDQISTRMSGIAHKVVDEYLELHSTLTADQRKTLVEEANRIHEHAGKHRRHRWARD